jgi:nucleotide-binding universal stress UspA family protein
MNRRPSGTTSAPTIILVRPAVLNAVTDTQLAELERQFDEGDREGFITRARSYGWTDDEIDAVWAWFSAGRTMASGRRDDNARRGAGTRVSSTSNGSGRVSYERVVVYLDRSERDAIALDHAATLAKSLDVPVHMLHIVDIASLAPVSLLGLDDVAFVTALALVDAETAAAVEYLEKQAGQRLVNQGFAPTFEVRRGLGLPDLVEAAQPGDLLVLAAPDRRGFTDWLLGDDMDIVIREVPAPVLLVHPAATATEASVTERRGA